MAMSSDDNAFDEKDILTDLSKMAMSSDDNAFDEKDILTDLSTPNYRAVEAEEENAEIKNPRELEGRVFYTVDEGLEYIGIGRYDYIWMLLYGMSFMTQAVEVTLASVIINDIACEWDLNLIEKVMIPSLVLIAAVPGDYIGGWLGDIYGRKVLLIVGQVLIAVFGVISAFTPTYLTFILTRCVVGFGFGMVTILVIVQVAELCPTAYRASAVSITFIMWAVGDCYIILGAYWFIESHGWRAVLLWASIPCVALCFVLPFADESPKYLAISNKLDAATLILNKIAVCNRAEMCPGHLEGVEEEERGRVMDMFQPAHRRTSLALMVSMFMANALYMGSIFNSLGLLDDGYCFTVVPSSSSNCVFSPGDLLSGFVICLGEFFSVPIFAVLSENLGRIKAAKILSGCLLVSVLSSCFCLGKIALIVELFATRCFSNAALLLFYIYTPESYPTYMRSIGFGIVMLACNLGGVVAVFVVYMIGYAYSWQIMWYIGVVAAALLTATAFVFQAETVGQRLADNRGP